MNNPEIIIKRTREELREYNVFTAITKSPFRRIMQYLIPVLGIAQIFIYFFVVRNNLNLIIGLFMMVYPFIVRYQIVRASDRTYDQHNVHDYEIKITFYEDHFTTENEVICQKIMYTDIYKIYNRNNDIFIYVSKNSGLYITKEAYTKEIVESIITLLQSAVPERF